jgi:hypothetical protein
MGWLERLRAHWLSRSDHAEGLAAGTGLLTGRAAEGRAGEAPSCPGCGEPGHIDVIDLVARETRYACGCGRRWVRTDIPGEAGSNR